LERGRFQIPVSQDGAITVEVDGTTLAMILGGVDLQTAQRRKRYQRIHSRQRDPDELAAAGCSLPQ
jgi:hypothetical protein